MTFGSTFNCGQGCGKWVGKRGEVCPACRKELEGRSRPADKARAIEGISNVRPLTQSEMNELGGLLENAPPDPTTGLPLVSLGQGDYTRNIGGDNRLRRVRVKTACMLNVEVDVVVDTSKGAPEFVGLQMPEELRASLAERAIKDILAHPRLLMDEVEEAMRNDR